MTVYKSNQAVNSKCLWARVTYKLEAAADGGLDVGATEGGDLAELPGDLDGVVEEEAQAALVAETCRAGNLSEQDWRMEREGRDRTGQDKIDGKRMR